VHTVHHIFLCTVRLPILGILLLLLLLWLLLSTKFILKLNYFIVRIMGEILGLEFPYCAIHNALGSVSEHMIEQVLHALIASCVFNTRKIISTSVI